MYSIQRSQVFPTCSYPQEQPKKATKCARNVVKLDIGNVIVGLKPGVNSARLKRMQHKPAEGIQISLGITPLHPVEGQHPYSNRKELNHFRPSVPAAQQQQHKVNRRQLFPHPPAQRFQGPEIPPMATGQRQL